VTSHSDHHDQELRPGSTQDASLTAEGSLRSVTMSVSATVERSPTTATRQGVSSGAPEDSEDSASVVVNGLLPELLSIRVVEYCPRTFASASRRYSEFVTSNRAPQPYSPLMFDGDTCRHSFSL